MDISVVSSLIGNLGFPIVCVMLLFYYINKKDERHKQEIDKLSETIDRLSDTVNNNTQIMLAFKEELQNII